MNDSPIARLRARLRAAIRGRDETIELVLVALLADGHVLLEDHPGSGKTTLAKTLGTAIADDGPEQRRFELFRRIQFTPDLLPSDVTGTSVFDRSTNAFHFRPGPIFTHVLLADEINRTSPKVQASLLEGMAEKQVTVDDQTHRLDELFFVIATQNPLDQAGTFPLPVAQLDRFLFKIEMTHLSADDELEVLRSIDVRRDASSEPVLSRSEVLAERAAASRVFVHDAINEALVDVAQRTRSDGRVLQGVSTRSLVLAIPAMKANAHLAERAYVRSEDMERLMPRILEHRLMTAPGVDPQTVVRDALEPALEVLARRTLAEAS